VFRPTFLRVYRKKSTEGFSCVPYVVALFSCTLWIFYALVKTNSSPLLTINAFGCVVESVYILLYLVYAPRPARLRALASFLLLDVAAFSLVAVVTLELVAEPHRVKVLGSICLAFSMAVFVAPMSVIVSIFMRTLLRALIIIIHASIYRKSDLKFLCSVCCDQDQERRVHALLPLLLPHPQRRRLVLLRPLHQGPLRHGKNKSSACIVRFRSIS
jgi:uncharacterized protein with PQ loop repeat